MIAKFGTFGPGALGMPRARFAEVKLDRNGLEVLDHETCLALLATATVGRVATTSDALPTILPVNFRLVGDRILFRTAQGTKLAAATRNAVVAFEVDEIDRMEHGGWSVQVIGVARRVTEGKELAELSDVSIARWAPLGDDHLVAISTEIVTGRRILAGTGIRREAG